MTTLLVASAPRASRKLVGLLWPAHSAAYFFRGTGYARYDLTAGVVEPPQDIAGNWPGLFDHDIDAALPWPDGSVYFFRGDQFIKYDLDARRAFGGSPRPIAGNWPGVFGRDLDAAVLWPGGERAYFFRGTAYVAYDVAADRALHGPRPIAGDWPGSSSGTSRRPSSGRTVRWRSSAPARSMTARPAPHPLWTVAGRGWDGRARRLSGRPRPTPSGRTTSGRSRRPAA